MTLQQEQREDWEEFSRLRAENELLRQQVLDMKRRIDTLIKKYTSK